MRIITVTFIDTEDGQIVVPDEPLPQNSIANKFDGEKYIIYEQGDELPPLVDGYHDCEDCIELLVKSS